LPILIDSIQRLQFIVTSPPRSKYEDNHWTSDLVLSSDTHASYFIQKLRLTQNLDLGYGFLGDLWDQTVAGVRSAVGTAAQKVKQHASAALHPGGDLAEQNGLMQSTPQSPSEHRSRLLDEAVMLQAQAVANAPDPNLMLKPADSIADSNPNSKVEELRKAAAVKEAAGPRREKGQIDAHQIGKVLSPMGEGRNEHIGRSSRDNLETVNQNSVRSIAGVESGGPSTSSGPLDSLEREASKVF
jgi:hypothetical protein